MGKQEINIDKLLEIARKAGDIILSYYEKNYDISIKGDESPVTEADIAANEYIVNELARLTPNIPIIAEENKTNHLEDNKGKFWVIDPIDGTKGFIEKDDQFTVNIALVNNQVPVFGVIYAPIYDFIYFTDMAGKAYKIEKNADRKVINARSIKSSDIDVLISKSNDPGIDEIKKHYQINSSKRVGSSLKICYIAEGLADAYPRFGLTMEWDTAAGHAILKAAGGEIVDYQNNPLIYGKADFKNPSFIAFAKKL